MRPLILKTVLSPKFLKSKETSEKGGVILIFAMFTLTLIPLLALSIDTYFMAQGRLEEQNLAEYAALTTLDGYVSVAAEISDHDVARGQALDYLKSIEGENGVTGLTAGSGWNFTPTDCESSSCQGGGWTLQFGTWDGSTFTPAVPEVPGEQESIDASTVDAIRITMEIPDGGFVDFFRTSVNNRMHGEGGASNRNIKLPASAIGYVVVDGSGDKYFRLARSRATGFDDI